jgi:ABC-type bacteriocin/lantibiotic exporter with double-glycine peptidase domain
MKAQFKLALSMVRYVLPYWKEEIIIFALGGAGILFGLLNPFIAKLVIDRAFKNRDLKVFIYLVALGALIYVLNGLVSVFKVYLERKIKLKADLDLNREVFTHLTILPLSYFQDKTRGEHVYNFIYHIEQVTSFVVTKLPNILILVFRVLSTFIIVFMLNWQIAFLTLLLTPSYYLFSYYYTKRRMRLWRGFNKTYEDIFRWLVEFFSKILLIKVFAAEAKELKYYLDKLFHNLGLNLKSAKLERMGEFGKDIVMRMIIGLIAFWGGYQVIKGRVTLGSLSAIMIYLNQLMGIHNQFAGFFETMSFSLISYQRIKEILDTRPQVQEAGETQEVVLENCSIELRDVFFGYRSGEAVIHNSSFKIEENKHICLTGPSGCGKTTLLNLILRLYDPWEGDIFIDGYNIKDLKISSLRDIFGVALQEPFLWNDSIKNNILYAKPSATDEELKQIERICLVDRFVEDLPNKYDTVIGEDACKLSEGQKQKIAIARALIKKPKFLILDEAMSSMDSASEEEIMRNIKEAYKELTIISVSHRLCTVLASDLAYFFKKPDEIVIDSPERLLEQDEEFHNLFAAQIREGLQVK